MSKLGANDLLSYVVENIPKTKRFSKLSQAELATLWRDTTAYICQQVTNKKSINFPGVGSFYMKKVKTVSVTGDTADTSVPCFVASKSWEKIPGFKVANNTTTGSSSAEPLNFAAVAGMTGFPRDDIEPGLRDIVHALFLVLKRGSNVSLLFADMGRLVFQNRDVKFCFTSDFLEMIATGFYRAPEVKVDVKKANTTSNTTAPTPLPAAPQPTEQIPEEISTEQPDDHHAEQAHKTHDIKTSTAATIFPSAVPPPGPKDPKDAELEEIERLAILLTTRSDTHCHPHADNRLWSNDKCPICRQKSQQVVDLKEKLTTREKTQDKMLLLLSLEVDREHLKQTREIESKKVSAAIGTAMYNHREALEKEIKRKTEKKNHPLGNIFENRDPGPDRVLQAKELKAGLHDQMTLKRTKKLREKTAKDIEDRELNERLLREFKTAEVQNHFDKLRRRQLQQEALTQQMANEQEARRREAILEPMTENSFARSESLMFLYQKEKAKQLYQEQLAILKQRREYESRVADMEKQHSLERLALSRKELQKDIQTIKSANFNTRKNLENTWGVQKIQREQAQAALGY